MFSHIFVGVKDFERALAFYHQLLPVLGVEARFVERDRPWAGWQTTGGPRPLFLIGTPYDKHSHEAGNGQVVAFAAQNRAVVHRAYAVALAHSAVSEGAPGLRPEYHQHYYGVLQRPGRQQAVRRLSFARELNASFHALRALSVSVFVLVASGIKLAFDLTSDPPAISSKAACHRAARWFVSIVLICVGCMACSTEKVRVSESIFTKESVIEFLNRFEEIAAKEDFDLIESMVHEEAFFRFNDGDFVGKQAVRRAFEKTWKSSGTGTRKERFYLTDIQVLSLDGRSAAATYTYNWEGTIDGRPFRIQGRGTRVLVIEGGRMQILHEHLSRFPRQ